VEKARALGKAVRRPGFIATIAGLTFVATAVAADKADIGNLKPQDVKVSGRGLPFDNAQPGKRDFGRLVWQGGLVLNSGSEHFGGYSGLAVDSKGERFLSVSDAGSWLAGRLEYKHGQLSGVSEARTGAIPQRDGRPLQGKRDRDAEALVALKPGALEGRYLIAFEGRHRLEEYAFEKGEMRGPLSTRPVPPQLKGMSSNAGLENATLIRGGAQAGALVVFAERKLTSEGNHTGALVKDGKAQPLFLKRHEDFDPTDLQSLADGSLVILERSFNPRMLRLGIRLRLIKAADIRPGALLTGETLLQAGPGMEIDNFEGLAVHETAKGESVLTLISDDNFNFLQRTLLMQFKLK